MRSFGTLLTAYYSGELLEHFDKKFSNSIYRQNDITKILSFLVYRITSIFPLLLAFIALFIKEKKYNDDNP